MSRRHGGRARPPLPSGHRDPGEASLIDMIEIGAGGGSIAHVQALGFLKVHVLAASPASCPQPPGRWLDATSPPSDDSRVPSATARRPVNASRARRAPAGGRAAAGPRRPGRLSSRSLHAPDLGRRPSRLPAAPTGPVWGRSCRPPEALAGRSDDALQSACGGRGARRSDGRRRGSREGCFFAAYVRGRNHDHRSHHPVAGSALPGSLSSTCGRETRSNDRLGVTDVDARARSASAGGPC